MLIYCKQEKRLTELPANRNTNTEAGSFDTKYNSEHIWAQLNRKKERKKERKTENRKKIIVF